MQLSYARLTLAIDFLLALGARSSIFVSGTGARIAQQLQPAETATQSWLSVTRAKSARALARGAWAWRDQCLSASPCLC